MMMLTWASTTREKTPKRRDSTQYLKNTHYKNMWSSVCPFSFVLEPSFLYIAFDWPAIWCMIRRGLDVHHVKSFKAWMAIWLAGHHPVTLHPSPYCIDAVSPRMNIRWKIGRTKLSPSLKIYRVLPTHSLSYALLLLPHYYLSHSLPPSPLMLTEQIRGCQAYLIITRKFGRGTPI